MKSSGFNNYHFFWKIHETKSNRRTANSHSSTPFENENDDNQKHTENNTDSIQGETSVEPNTDPTDNTRQNPPQIPDTSYSEINTAQRPNPSAELQQNFSELFSSELHQSENEGLRLQHQKRSEDANQLLRKQELELDQLIQQLN